MAFKLTKAEEARLDSLIDKAVTEVGKLEDGKSELEEAITKLIDAFNDRYLAPFNEFMSEARGFVEDIQNERQDEFDDKSERWQESERADSARTWIEAYENAVEGLDDLGLVEAPPVDLEIPDVAEELNLPREMEL